MMTVQKPPEGRPQIVLRPSAVIAPAAGAVLLDTGPAGPNTVFFELFLNATANANGVAPRIEHRNALNSANLESEPLTQTGSFSPTFLVEGTTSPAAGITPWAVRSRYNLAPGERVRIVTDIAAAAGESWQASADVWVLR